MKLIEKRVCSSSLEIYKINRNLNIEICENIRNNEILFKNIRYVDVKSNNDWFPISDIDKLIEEYREGKIIRNYDIKYIDNKYMKDEILTDYSRLFRMNGLLYRYGRTYPYSPLINSEYYSKFWEVRMFKRIKTLLKHLNNIHQIRNISIQKQYGVNYIHLEIRFSERDYQLLCRKYRNDKIKFIDKYKIIELIFDPKVDLFNICQFKKGIW